MLVCRNFSGASESLSDFLKKMSSKLVDQVDHLILIAQSQPHCSFFGLTHGLFSKWTSFFRTTPNLKHLLQPLEDSICLRLLHSWTGQEAFNEYNHLLLVSLPARLGVMGIINPFATADMHYQSSVMITALISSLILHPSTESIVNPHESVK